MDDKAEAEIRRGQRAAAFLEEGSVFREAWQEMADAIMEKWRNSPVRDSEGREWLWTMHRVMGDLERAIVQYVNDGKMAAERIQAEEREKALNGQ